MRYKETMKEKTKNSPTKVRPPRKRYIKSFKEKTGRPPFAIDWVQVDKLIEGGSSGVQVASFLGVHYDTLYHAVEREFKKSYTEYSASKKEKGNASLLCKQYNVAMQGDKTMLIWLGKQRLGQKESPSVEEKFSTKIGEWLDSLKPDEEKTKLKEEVERLKKLLSEKSS